MLLHVVSRRLCRYILMLVLLLLCCIGGLHLLVMRVDRLDHWILEHGRHIIIYLNILHVRPKLRMVRLEDLGSLVRDLARIVARLRLGPVHYCVHIFVLNRYLGDAGLTIAVKTGCSVEATTGLADAVLLLVQYVVALVCLLSGNQCMLTVLGILVLRQRSHFIRYHLCRVDMLLLLRVCGIEACDHHGLLIELLRRPSHILVACCNELVCWYVLRHVVLLVVSLGLWAYPLPLK